MQRSQYRGKRSSSSVTNYQPGHPGSQDEAWVRDVDTLWVRIYAEISVLSAKHKQQFKINIFWYAIYNFVIRDVDEMTSEASLSEEKAQRAMIDAARLADEVRIIFSNFAFSSFVF